MKHTINILIKKSKLLYMSDFLIIDHFKSQPDIITHITNDNHLPISTSNKKITNSHKQNIENSSFDDEVQEPQEGGGKLYIVNNEIKFRTIDKNPEKIGALIVAPSKKNCEFLISMGKTNKTNKTLFKCVKKNGKVIKVTPLYYK
tara:strand:- start:1606 stop:2040 length:435 start_codon:yes stop_codon:yes gene_type:complete